MNGFEIDVDDSQNDLAKHGAIHGTYDGSRLDGMVQVEAPMQMVNLIL
jgi:hypothetical protein